jgi:uncharacterized protein with LGFP repeats
VTVNNSQGVQAGDHNHQTNVFLHRSSNLSALNPHSAAAKVRAMTRDEAVEALASVPADDAAEILKVILLDDEPSAVSLLAHLNGRFSRSVIAVLAPVASWLESLPDASAAIAERERADRARLGSRLAEVEHAGPSPRGTHGFRQRHVKGVIMWSEHGTYVVSPDHATRVDRDLGFPLTSANGTTTSSFGTSASFQHFEGPFRHHRRTCEQSGLTCGATAYFTTHARRVTRGGIGDYHAGTGGPAGPLGLPTTDDRLAGPSPSGTSGWRQDFEGGVVYHAKDGGVFTLSPAVARYHDGRRGVARLGFPTGPERAVTSSAGAAAVAQEFERGVTVYSSASSGTHAVHGDFANVYSDHDWLGFPTSDETIDEITPLGNRTWQQFQGGAIYQRPRTDPVVVAQAVAKALAADPALIRRIGFPVAPEQRLTDDETDRVQLFERGLVTVRGGLATVWTAARGAR